MDEADLAQEREQAILAAALSTRQRSLESPNGKCIWCKDEPVVPDTAFCSADCGEDHYKHSREMKHRISGEFK